MSRDGYKIIMKALFVMALSETVRGELGQYIDIFIKYTLPEAIPRFREKQFKDLFSFQSERDFLYGVAFGAIIFGFFEKFVAPHHENVTQEDIIEIQTVIANRMKEVRPAIDKTGMGS